MGFPPNWVTLIMGCVTTVNFSIMLNGAPQAPFVPQRGLRQGDPLSPYLFILCGEVFSSLINKVVMSAALHGIKVARSAPVISHLLFADDSIIFARSTREEMECVKNILSTYERVSGQVINLDKSTLIGSRNVPQNRLNELKGLLNVKAVECFDKYLGLPTMIGRSKTQIFNFVKDRVWKKLKGWKESALSRAGREVLIKAVAQAIPSYVMSCFILPDGICDQIEGVSTGSGGILFVGLKVMADWGLETSSLLIWLLLGKLGGESCPNQIRFLAKVFKAVYFPRASIFRAKKGYRPSYAWSSILRASWVLEEGGLWCVGSGSSIRAWEDRWVPNSGPLVYRENVASDLGVTRVAHLLLQDGSGWNRELVEHLCWPPTAAAILSIPISIQNHDDAFFWPATVDGNYSTKSGYKFIRDRLSNGDPGASSWQSLDHGAWNKLWKVDAAPRCRETSWRACLELLPVRAELSRRGMELDPSCPWCVSAPESTQHSLLFCPVIKPIWFASPLGLRLDNECTVREFLAAFLPMADSYAAGWCCALLYAIWDARNELLFQRKALSLQQILKRAQLLLPSQVAVQSSTRHARELPSKWRRPAPSIFKINFDASVLASKEAGFGYIARNSRGEVLSSATSSFAPVMSALLAEALCFRWALHLSSELGFRRVSFETDCLVLYDYWRQGKGGTSHLETIVRDCRFLCSHFDVVDFCFVRRAGNGVADALAKLAFRFGTMVWIEEAPLEVSSRIQDDVVASMASS
ncbi:uncharacterized protein LOC130719383 [Lotus japonicus]|uniref:uncharacterized protein LOC130719383 n=1 Tax=Lotus japonicus TaxID=34305 RepID=UPI002583C6D9|nr:uncharacterized protein LOC130719383 [Lotus japonicus]